jgi:hypothetical protein
MGGWTFFADLFNSLIAPNMQALLAMLGQVCATASRVALPLIAIMFVLSFFEMAAGTKSLQAFFKEAFVAALVYGFLQEAQYTQFIVNMVTQGAPNTIARAMGGTGSPVASLDNLLAAVVVEVAKVYEALPSYSLKTVPLALADLFAMGLSAVCIAFCFGVYVVATIINIGALVVGPLFMAGAVAPWSRKFAMGWVAVLVGGCVTQLISVAMLQLLITGEMNLIHASAAAAASCSSSRRRSSRRSPSSRKRLVAASTQQHPTVSRTQPHWVRPVRQPERPSAQRGGLPWLRRQRVSERRERLLLRVNHFRGQPEMQKLLWILLVMVTLTGCGNISGKPLPMVSRSDPTWELTPDHLQFGELPK